MLNPVVCRRRMKASTSVWLRARRGWRRGPSRSRFRVSSTFTFAGKQRKKVLNTSGKSDHSHTSDGKQNPSFKKFVRIIPAPLFCTSCPVSSLQYFFSPLAFQGLDSKCPSSVFLQQSTGATPTGRNGLRAVAPADRASKKGSDCATAPNQPTEAGRAAAPASTLGNVKLDSVLVRRAALSTLSTAADVHVTCF